MMSAFFMILTSRKLLPLPHPLVVKDEYMVVRQIFQLLLLDADIWQMSLVMVFDVAAAHAAVVCADNRWRVTGAVTPDVSMRGLACDTHGSAAYINTLECNLILYGNTMTRFGEKVFRKNDE